MVRSLTHSLTDTNSNPLPDIVETCGLKIWMPDYSETCHKNCQNFDFQIRGGGGEKKGGKMSKKPQKKKNGKKFFFCVFNFQQFLKKKIFIKFCYIREK